MAKPTKKAAPRAPWNAREFLLSVTGYLTTRPEPLVFSSHHDAAPIADIIGKIADANGLPGVRKSWKKIHIPDGLEGITNARGQIVEYVVDNEVKKEPTQFNLKAAKTDPQGLILEIIRLHPLTHQNGILASIVKEMGNDRILNIDQLQTEGKQLQAQHEHAQKVREEFLSIVK